MKLTLFVVVSAAVFVNANPVKNDLEAEWAAFKLKYKKEYNSPSEENLRKEMFIKTFNKITDHNILYHKGLVSYTMKINKYSDKTTEEINKTRKGYRKSTRTNQGIQRISFAPNKEVIVPDEIDWRNLGAVTEVKDQGNCGACWAFSATGALESQHFLKTGNLEAISEQNLIDCSNQGVNDGCDGGDPTDAFAYVHLNDGIDSEEFYPYAEKTGLCNFKKSANVTSVKIFGDVETGNEDYLKTTVATVGPVSADIYTDDSFQGYASGVYYNACCKEDDPNHSVLVVGYGTTLSGMDYWIVKNSWGDDWGDKGYIKMARNSENNCGIASSSSFPIMY